MEEENTKDISESESNEFPTKEISNEQVKRKVPREFRCASCDSVFTSKPGLRSHIRKVHKPELINNSQGGKKNNTDVCTICGQVTDDLFGHLERHLEEASTYHCPLCDRTFRGAGAYKSHQSVMHTTLKEFPFKCSVCDRLFRTLGPLNMHKKTHSPHSNEHMCEVCGKIFYRKYKLEMHLRSHTGEKIYPCDICGRKLATRSAFKYHYRIHTGEKPYTCEVCSKSFTRKDFLVQHTRTHTGEKPHRCEICNKSFSQTTTLSIHKRSHTGERPYSCNICSKTFLCGASLSIHMKTHGNAQRFKVQKDATALASLSND